MPTLYMPLRNEGTDAWRPVNAESHGAGTFRVIGPMPSGEDWLFPPDSIVATARHRFVDGSFGIVAVAVPA
jgi:hypothetical protein